MKSNLWVVLLMLVIGLAVGFQIGQRSSMSSDSRAEKISTGMEKLQGLADTDLADYYRLKTLEERYLKADEVMGKIIAIFLADLGIRMNPEVLRAVKESVEKGQGSANIPEDDGSPTSYDEQEQARSGVSARPQNRLQKKATAEPENRLATRASTREVRHDHEIEDFLRVSQIEEFDQVVKKSNGFVNKAGVLDQINGTFIGSANVMSRGKAKVWEVDFELKGQITNGKFEGSRKLKLSEKGQVFSNSSGDGNLGNDFREIPVDPEAIITRAGPSTYLQFYYLKSIDSLVGNILEQEDVAEGFKTIGSFKLSRRY